MAKEERVITPLPKTEDEIAPAKLLFFCKPCKKVIVAKQTKKKFVFACPTCNKTDVAFGTEISVKNFYHLSDEDVAVARA